MLQQRLYLERSEVAKLDSFFAEAHSVSAGPHNLGDLGLR